MRPARLAAALERAVASADEDHRGFTAQVPVSRAAVIEARTELLSLARELELREHPGPDGVALTRRLLSDACGPLYSPRRPEDLVDAARRARAAL